MFRQKLKMQGLGVFLGGILLAQSAQAGNGPGPEPWAMKGHKKIAKGIPIPKTLPKIWANITVFRASLGESIEDWKQSEAHNIVYAIRDHVRTMSKKSSLILSKSKLENLKDQSKIITSLAEDIDESVETGEEKRAWTLIRLLDKELMRVQELFSEGVLKAEGTYTCPIQPEIVSGNFGKCPKCGMDLIVAK